MKWPQRWVAAFVVTLPAGKGKGTAVSSYTLVSLHPFSSQGTLLRLKITKMTKELYLWGSGSFKVTDVDTTKKHVTSVCYDKQHVSAYM